MKKSLNYVDFIGPLQLSRYVINNINANPDIEVEYFEIVDEETLKPIDKWRKGKKITGCIAAYTGGVRLIDNIKYK